MLTDHTDIQQGLQSYPSQEGWDCAFIWPEYDIPGTVLQSLSRLPSGLCGRPFYVLSPYLFYPSLSPRTQTHLAPSPVHTIASWCLISIPTPLNLQHPNLCYPASLILSSQDRISTEYANFIIHVHLSLSNFSGPLTPNTSLGQQVCVGAAKWREQTAQHQRLTIHSGPEILAVLKTKPWTSPDKASSYH